MEGKGTIDQSGRRFKSVALHCYSNDSSSIGDFLFARLTTKYGWQKTIAKYGNCLKFVLRPEIFLF